VNRMRPNCSWEDCSWRAGSGCALTAHFNLAVASQSGFARTHASTHACVRVHDCAQASGEGTRFHADYVGSALAAYLRGCGVRAQYEEYPLDEVYRCVFSAVLRMAVHLRRALLWVHCLSMYMYNGTEEMLLVH
jgi:hypothetical protein